MSSQIVDLARLTLFAFLLTFIFVRNLVYFMNKGTVRNVFFQVKGTHIHHLNFGIFLLAGVGGYMLFVRPSGLDLDATALVYGAGMALTFDEFAIWLHLDDNYWQRASWDAVGVIAALLGLIGFFVTIVDFEVHHWVIGTISFLAATSFFYILLKSLKMHGLWPPKGFRQ